jgi:hypothetical protein
LHTLDDVRDEITQFLRTHTDGGTLETMLNTPIIREYRTFDFNAGSIPKEEGVVDDEEEEDEDEENSGPFVHQLRRLTAKEYFGILSKPWITDLKNRNTVIMLLGEMKSQGLLKSASTNRLRSSGILDHDLQYSRHDTTSADLLQLQSIFAGLAE